jgi:hypothetical protein
MKHEGFHLRFFLRSFVFKGVSDSIKSLHVWQLVMIQVIDISVQCASDTINVNMSEISLVPKVAFIEIAPLSPNERMVYN